MHGHRHGDRFLQRNGDTWTIGPKFIRSGTAKSSGRYRLIEMLANGVINVNNPETLPLPSATINSPNNGTSIGNATTNQSINATVSSSAGIKNATAYVNGVSLGTLNTTPFLWYWDPRTKATDCNITVIATDNNNNTVADRVIVIKGAQSYYNKLNVGGSVSVIDPVSGATVAFTLAEIYVADGVRKARISISNQPTLNDAQAGKMYKVGGLFIYPATLFIGTETFSEIMIAPYQYPSLDIIIPVPNISTNNCIVQVATNYSGKNVPWNGIGNPPENTENLKSLSFNGSSAQYSENFTWVMSGANGPRTMQVNMTDKIGATVSKSVTVNYNSSLAFLVYTGPYGDLYKGFSISTSYVDYERVYCDILFTRSEIGQGRADASSRYCWGNQLSRDRAINFIADCIVGVVNGGFCCLPAGATAVFVVDKNQYLNSTINLNPYGTVSYKEIYDLAAGRLGKDSQGKYRIWYGTTPDRSDAVPLPCLNLPTPGAPSYTGIQANEVTVSWGDLYGEAGYQLQRGLGFNPSTWSNIGSQLAADVTRYTDNALTAGVTYSYRVIGKGCAPCADATGAASSVTTVSSDGITNGNFDGVGGWNFTHVVSSTVSWDYSLQGRGYITAHCDGGARKFHGYIRQSFTVPGDACSLKYVVKSSRRVYDPNAYPCYYAYVGVRFGTQTYSEEYTSYTCFATDYLERSFDISGYRGKSVTFEIYDEVSTVSGSGGNAKGCISIDNVRIVGTIPSVAITAPANGSSVPTGAATTITATASDLNGSINRVEFYANGDCIGQDFTSPYTCDWTPAIAKSYTIMAKAYDMTGNTNSATATVTATGLAGHWKLDAVMGTVATDNSGNDNQGTLVNGPTWVAGQVGNALNFTSDVDGDGLFCYNGEVRQGVSIPDNNSLDITSAITVAGWFKLGPTGMGHSLACKWNAYDVRIQPDGIWSAFWGLQPDNGHIFAAATINRGQWYHTAVIYDGTAIKIYLDGTLLRSVNQTGALTSNGSALWIGSNDGGGQFTGLIDEVRIYNKALSGTEVLVLYNIFSNNFDDGNANGWTVSGLWHVTAHRSCSPSYSLVYNQEATHNYNTGGTNSGAATFDVALPASPVLEFDHCRWVESWNGAYDVSRVEISTNGGSTWGTLRQWDSRNPTTNPWERVSISLSGYTGAVKIRFNFNTIDGLYNDHEGWYIDNVVVKTGAKDGTPVQLVEAEQGPPRDSGVPLVTQLMQSAPNPFTGQTTINFQLVAPAQTTIKVYNIQGQLVKTLVNECVRPGYHSVKWDGRDGNGNKVAAGVYLYRMQAGDYSATKKMTVIR